MWARVNEHPNIVQRPLSKGERQHARTEVDKRRDLIYRSSSSPRSFLDSLALHSRLDSIV